jgi:hypothetical protein
MGGKAPLMAELQKLPETAEILMAYAVLNQRPSDPAAFRKLVGPGGPLWPLTAACFLLYRPAELPQQKQKSSGLSENAGVRRFILYTSPVLLGQLNRTTQSRRVLMRGRTRGKVDWPATYKRRFSEDSNPSVFVCLQSWRRFDRPENQLFVYLLRAVQDCLRSVPRWLWDWQAWGLNLQDEEAEGGMENIQRGEAEEAEIEKIENSDPMEIGDFFALLVHRLRLLRGHIALQEIAVPQAVSSRQLMAATTSKNELYSELADFYDLYQAVVGYPEWVSWRQVVMETLPMPESASEIGEYLRLDARNLYY